MKGVVHRTHALATLDVLEQDNLIQEVNSIAPKFEESLRSLCGKRNI